MADPYLVAHRPKRTQFNHPRRAKPTGLTVIHTAESILDTVGPDTGAESVAAFMVRRADPGSYHDIVDADSALQLVRYGDAAFQDGTGSNQVALSISFALRASDWSRLTPHKRAAFLAQGAKAFARQQAWLRANGRPLTPLRRITRRQSEAGVAGFIAHADRDPGRRSDPGSGFPWTEFFVACASAIAPPRPPTPTTPPARRSAPTMFVTRFGSSGYRLVTGDRIVGLSKVDFDKLTAAGIPSTALTNDGVRALEKTLVAEIAPEHVDAGQEG